jgi:glycosyltransferase involved in cell wall biosynthesis
MKVLFVSTLYHPHGIGGAEASVRLLAEACHRAGDEAVVVTLAPRDGAAVERDVGGVRVHDVPLWNIFHPYPWPRPPAWRALAWHMIDAWNPVMAGRLAAIVAREAPDIVHVHNLLGFSAAIWPALARIGVPVVQTLHDHYVACTNSLMYREGRNCRTRCVHCRVLGTPRRRLSRHVDVVTAVSRRLLDRVSGFGIFAGVGPRLVIPNPNPLQPRLPVPRASPDPARALRVGFLGRVEPIKGPEVLLAAAQRLGPGRIDLRLGGAARPDYLATLKPRFGGPGIAFLGPVEPAEFLESIDMLVVPSVVEEAAGRVVHEAFAAGVPVIGAAIGGIPELIRDGATGFLVPPGDVDALERRLRLLHDAPPDWAAMSAACLAEAERFGLDAVLAAYRAAWAQAVSARRAAPAAVGGARAAAIAGRARS